VISHRRRFLDNITVTTLSMLRRMLSPTLMNGGIVGEFAVLRGGGKMGRSNIQLTQYGIAAVIGPAMIRE
jgi:hypothetical protein